MEAALLNVSESVIGIIVFFWMFLAIMIFGIECIGKSNVLILVVFMSLITTLIIGTFGWQILIIPSIIIIIGSVFLIRRFFRG